MSVPSSRRGLLCAGLILVVLAAVLLALDRSLPPPLARIEQTSVLVLDDQDRILRGFITPQGTWRLPARTEDVDPLYLQMLLAYEDQRFASHPGVDPLALARALGQWFSHGRVVSGASTLTMQTARLLEPHPRDLSGKFGEMLRALQLERRYDKQAILDFYLTLAPYGGNLEGVRAAALAWFGKEPSRLTAAEAALLVVLPQAPSRLRPDRFPERARAARDKVLARMGQLGVLSERQVAEARQEPLRVRRRSLPFLAPHLASRLRAAQPTATVHRSFIDRGLQQTLETLARQQQSALEPNQSMAILVAANRDRRVLAYVGGSDFFDPRRAGQVDMVQAIRSPGSTLKPLVYGLGFDDLLIHPETLIEDAPTRFGSYSPTNFLNTYAGQLTVREALQQSLNIPAVAVLEQVGPARVAARLREVGLPLHWNAAHPQPGLPLVLGGVGMTLEELVALYAGFADGGRVAPLRFGPDERQTPERALLSEVACWYLSEILRTAPTPQNVPAPSSVAQPRAIAYKTGTSYGFRDAWALGFDADYTVGIWVGRPDGSPSPGHYGRNTAAPLLFRVFDLLPEHTAWPTTSPPAGVLQVSRDRLPERLRYFRTRPALEMAGAPPLGITFPVAGSTVELPGPAGTLAELPLAAKGGVKPLRWLVNGQPIAAAAWRRDAFWQPDGEGLARITVLDQAGQTASAEVWISRGAAAAATP
ncbi:MAG TPA: penicillin-binding protein 1C [Candidatus Competibacteraceae bacterium]|nr:penicillin-binding protein 1C [Candidatus Competibacteraceae bacterium]HQA26358.1 penicillin-binding protein 1C [Candidatus Competibacteraceae bacterium]